jgi:prepilin-type processing-associated H-X9-DG protein
MDEQMGTTDVKKDPVCTTNEMGKFHRYQRGHAVYVDGHVEKMQ